MHRQRLLSALAVLAVACVRVVHATTLVVPDQYSTVQAALVAAASGDSIEVHAGVYDESLSLAGRDVVVRGEIDGTVLTTAASGRILDIGSGVTLATVFEGLIFRSGQALNGGGVHLGDGAAVTLRTCRFIANSAHAPSGSAKGGALLIDPGCRADLDSCSFVNNHATSATFDQCYGGAVLVGATGQLDAQRCRFEDNSAAGFEGGSGGALAAEDDAQTLLQDCAFARNSAGYGGAIQAPGGLTVERSRFEGNFGVYGAAAIQNNGYLHAVSIADNVFTKNDAIGSAVLEVIGPGEMTGNTIAFNGEGQGLIGVRFGGGIQVERNIIVATSGVGLWCQDALATIGCNDVWSNGGGNYGGACGDQTGVNGNISEDPLFCDPPKGVLALMEGSPCAPSSTCGLIGALPVGCPVTGVPVIPSGHVARLLPPHPHPASIPVRFTFELARMSGVRLEVFDLLGRRLATLENRVFDPGRHDVTWDGRSSAGVQAASGVYVAVLRAGTFRDAQRFVLRR